MNTNEGELAPYEEMELEGGTNENSQSPTEQTPRGLGQFGLAALALSLFFFFLVMKLPEARIQNFVIAHAKIQAQNFGYSFNAEKVSLSLIFGPALKFYNMELKALDDESKSIKIEYLKVRPVLLSLLPFSSTKKVSLVAELFGGDISGTLGLGTGTYSTDLSIKNISLEKAKSLLSDLPLQPSSAYLSANADLLVNTVDAKKSNGTLKLQLKKFLLPSQSFFGFNVPKIAISESNIDLSLTAGRFNIRAFEIGKDVKTDDLFARISGDGSIDDNKGIYNFLDRIKVNLTAVFEISSGVKTSFPFLDSLLGSAKGQDGKYRYRLSGTLSAPTATPGG